MSSASEGDDCLSQPQPAPPVPLCVFFLTPLQPPALLPPLQPPRPRAARGERVTKKRSPAGGSRRDGAQPGGRRDHEHAVESNRRQAWPAPRSASLDRTPRRCREMGTGGRSVAIPGPVAPRGPRHAAPRRAALPLRRYSVPETVMRRCSLRSEQSHSSDSGDGLSPTRGREHDRSHKVTKKRDVLDDNHNDTSRDASGCPQCASVVRISRSEVRCARRVSVERSAQSSALSSERTCTACSECYSAQLTTMHEEAQWTESSSERLCVHCGRRATGSKPCTPKEALAGRNQAHVSVKLEDPAVNQCVDVSSVRDKGVVRTESKVVCRSGRVPQDHGGSAFTMATQTQVSDFPDARTEGQEEWALNRTKPSESVFQNEGRTQQSASLNMILQSTLQETSASKTESQRIMQGAQRAEATQGDKSSVSVNVSQDENASKVRIVSKEKGSQNELRSSIRDRGNNTSTQLLAKQSAQVEGNKDVNTRQDVKIKAKSSPSRIDHDNRDVRVRTNVHCRLTDIIGDQDKSNVRSGYRKLEDQTPELMSASEEASSSFNLSLAGLSTNGSPSPSSSPSSTPTPSPTTFRSRRPSSERLSTPESLRSGPIEGMDMNLKSSSSSNSLDRFSRVESPTSPQSGPSSPQRARNPRFGARTSSSLDTRTPTPYRCVRQGDFSDKVHVVSDTSSFIVLDELDNDDELRNRGASVSDIAQKKQYAARHPNQPRRGASFEVLHDTEYTSSVAPEKRARRPINASSRHEDDEMRVSKRRAKCHNPPPAQVTEGRDLNDMERDSLNGSVIDMFGVDEEGNVLFSESGVQSRRGSKFSCSGDKQNGGQRTDVKSTVGASTHVAGHAASAAGNINPLRANDSNNNDNNTRVSCSFHVNNNIDSINNRNNGNEYRETVKSDHHSQEQTFFCGVKEVYSVTTEKVEKWGSESREWLEKTTSHRIQHQHPHEARASSEIEKQFNLSNRINIANNNPILIASEILEIPPEQRFRTTPARPGAGGQDFTLPSIRTSQEPSKAQSERGKTTGGRRLGEVPESQPAASEAAPAHVRFVNGDQYEWSVQQQQNAQRQRRIVTDLVGTEPAEVQVAVPRYSALPRTRSMLVNTSSGEEDEDGNDSGSECLSCADSLESERTPRSAIKHDDKPVRGQVVLPEPKSDKRTKRIRIQSPKAFFVSLSEDQTDEEDLPVSARLPRDLREKLIERHTMVKLQMAQNKRFLRTVCDASILKAHPSRSVRVGVSSKRDLDRKKRNKSNVAVEVEIQGKTPTERATTKSPKRDYKADQSTQHQTSKSGQSLVTREKSRGKREVPAVVRVHKCHTEDQVKTTFKAKPYKASVTAKVSAGTSTHDKQHEHGQAKRLKEEASKRTMEQKISKRNVKVQVKSDEVKGKSQRIHRSSQVKFEETTDKGSKDVASQVYSKERGAPTVTAHRGEDKTSARLDATWTKTDYDKSAKKERVSIEHSHTTGAHKNKQVSSTHVQSHQKSVTSKEASTSQTKGTQIHESEVKQPSTYEGKCKDLSHTVETQTTPRVNALDKIVRKEAIEEFEKTSTVTRRAVEMTSIVKQKHDKTQAKVQMESSVNQKHGEHETKDLEQVHTVASDTKTLRVPSDGTDNVSTEVTARVHIDQKRHPQENSVCPRANTQTSNDDQPSGTSVHTSVKTTVEGQDGTIIPLETTNGDQNRLRNLLELGTSLPDAEIRQKVVAVETTIQKNSVRHNVVETETTVEKNIISKRINGIECRSVTPKAQLRSDPSFTPGVEVQVPTPPPYHPALELSRSSRVTVPAAAVRRQPPVQRFRQRFEVIPEERNGHDESRRFIVEDRLSVLADGHSSSKGRAALHQRVEDVDLLTLSKGWINFYQMEEPTETEDLTADRGVSAAVERVEYTMQIRAVPESPPPTHASVAVGSSPPPKAVDVAVSMTTDAAVGTTSTVDAAVSATRPVDAAVSATRPVDVAVSATGPVDVGVSTARTADAAVSATRAVDVAVSTTKTVDASVSTSKAIDASVSTADVPAQKTSPARARRPALPARGAAARPAPRVSAPAPQRATGPATHRAAAPTHSVSKASGPATYQARAVGTTDLEDASTNTLCGPLLPPPLFRKTEAFTMTRSDACTGMNGAPRVEDPHDEAAGRTRDASAGTAGVAPCGIVSLSSCRRTVLTRQEKLPKITADISDVMSTSSDSTEYMAPPGARDADWDSTSPCLRRAPKNRPGRAGRGRPRNGVKAPAGLYQHQVPPQPQQAGPPPRDGVGWTVTLAGAGAKQQGTADLEMRLMFPTEDSAAKSHGETKDTGVNTQPVISAPPGRWSLTIRNELSGDSESAQGLSLSMVPGHQESSTTDKRVRGGRSALPDKPLRPARRPLSLVWPRMHQDAASPAAPELSEAETVLSVTGSAIQRRTRHQLGHRR